MCPILSRGLHLEMEKFTTHDTRFSLKLQRPLDQVRVLSATDQLFRFRPRRSASKMVNAVCISLNEVDQKMRWWRGFCGEWNVFFIAESWIKVFCIYSFGTSNRNWAYSGLVALRTPTSFVVLIWTSSFNI